MKFWWARPLPPLPVMNDSITDVLYLASNRLEFTRASLTALLAATPPDRGRIKAYVDRDTSGTADFVREVLRPGDHLYETNLGSPVAVMNDFIQHHLATPIFAKVDNDLVVCPGWLETILAAMERQPEFDLVGIEPQGPSWTLAGHSIQPASHIGGIGLMRRRVFEDRELPRPHGYFGFTGWQYAHIGIQKGWLVPALPVFLLDHLPLEPWASLGAQYREKHWQRQPWGYYTPEYAGLWAWWAQQGNANGPAQHAVEPDQKTVNIA